MVRCSNDVPDIRWWGSCCNFSELFILKRTLLGETNGKMGKFNYKKESVLGSCRRYSNLSYLSLCLWLVGCTTLKKAGIISTIAGIGATVGFASSTGAIAPILGATTGAFVGAVATDLTIGSPKEQVMTSCAPDNFWTLLGSLVEMGGWLLILVILVPMILGWLMPGPLEKKRKD